MDLVTAFGAIIAVNFLAWITPGPNMFAVMAASLEHGREHGVATGFGLALAAFIWALLAVLGVSILFDLLPGAVAALKLAGACYLIWLGLRSITSATVQRNGIVVSSLPERRLSQSFRTGFLVSMTNPKAALFFSSVMTAFIPAGAAAWFLVMVVALCGVLAVVFHTITATVFSTAIAVRRFDKAKRWIMMAFGVVFLGLGGTVVYGVLRRQ